MVYLVILVGGGPFWKEPTLHSCSSAHFILEGAGFASQVTKRRAEGGESDDTYLSAYDHLKLSRDQAGRRFCVCHLLELPPSGRRLGNRLG
jgi:hypothetical protein